MVWGGEFSHEASDQPLRGPEGVPRDRIIVGDYEIFKSGPHEFGRDARAVLQRLRARFSSATAGLGARQAGALDDLPAGSSANGTYCRCCHAKLLTRLLPVLRLRSRWRPAAPELPPPVRTWATSF